MEEIDVAVVGVDHQFPIGPLGIFVSTDQERQGELFEQLVVEALEIVIGQGGEDGTGLVDVGEQYFVGELVEQEFMSGSFVV